MSYGPQNNGLHSAKLCIFKLGRWAIKSQNYACLLQHPARDRVLSSRCDTNAMGKQLPESGRDTNCLIRIMAADLLASV